MINYKSLQTNLAALIKTLTNQVIVWSNQNANTPNGDFLAMKITSMKFIGATDWTDKPDETGNAATQGDRELILSIQSISQNAMEILLDLLNKLNLNSTLELLSSKKLAYVGLDGDIADITVQINNSFETRATGEFVFRISKNYSNDAGDDVEVIESVETQGELDGNALVDPVLIDLIVESE